MADFEQALRVAHDLLTDGDDSGGEYRRGVVELLANLYGVEDMPSGERADMIERWLGSFTLVENCAHAKGYEPIAVGWRGPDMGVIAFARRDKMPHGEESDDAFGTVEFLLHEGGATFPRPHSNLSAKAAMDDFRRRLGANR